MTQEEKQLLLADLSARLPYGVMVYFEGWNPEKLLEINLRIDVVNDMGGLPIPYLRPMSSLIGKELDECRATCKYRQVGQSVLDCATPQTIDYLISHHFDFRGLIEKGLALEAPEGMYKI